MIEYLGNLTIGECAPGAFTALLSAEADLNARVKALADFAVTVVPPSLEADIALCLEMIAMLRLNITLGIQPPSIALQFQLVVDLVAALTLQLELILELMNAMSTAGVHLYHYSGQVGDFGSELTTALASGLGGGGSPSDACQAIVLATTLGATWLAMSKIFKVGP